jgi:DNA-directed RNA polymerase subunit L
MPNPYIIFSTRKLAVSRADEACYASFLNSPLSLLIMEVKILEEKKSRLVFNIEGDGSTMANMLKKELWNDEHVKAAGFNVEHPLINIPTFIVETDGADPKKTVSAAIKRIAKSVEKFKDEAKALK